MLDYVGRTVYVIYKNQIYKQRIYAVNKDEFVTEDILRSDIKLDSCIYKFNEDTWAYTLEEAKEIVLENNNGGKIEQYDKDVWSWERS